MLSQMEYHSDDATKAKLVKLWELIRYLERTLPQSQMLGTEADFWQAGIFRHDLFEYYSNPYDNFTNFCEVALWYPILADRYPLTLNSYYSIIIVNGLNPGVSVVC